VVGVSNFHYHQPLNKVPVMGNFIMSYDINTLADAASFIANVADCRSFLRSNDFQVKTFEDAQSILDMNQLVEKWELAVATALPYMSTIDSAKSMMDKAAAVVAMANAMKPHEPVLGIYCEAMDMFTEATVRTAFHFVVRKNVSALLATTGKVSLNRDTEL
jgi:hypothetical protein